MFLFIESKACSLNDLPVVFFSIILAVVVTPDWNIDAVEKPDVAGPIKAIGAIKHPDSNNPRVVRSNNFFIIESPLLCFLVYRYFSSSESFSSI